MSAKEIFLGLVIGLVIGGLVGGIITACVMRLGGTDISPASAYLVAVVFSVIGTLIGVTAARCDS